MARTRVFRWWRWSVAVLLAAGLALHAEADISQTRRQTQRARLLLRAREELQELCRATELHWEHTDSVPTLEELQQQPGENNLNAVDPWGAAYSMEAPKPGEIWFVSSGPDRIPGTSDDLELAVYARSR